MTDAPEKILGKTRTAIALLNSMVICGESHSDTSEQVVKDALAELSEYTRTDIADERIAELEEALESILKIPNSEAAQGIMKVFAHSALGDKT